MLMVNTDVLVTYLHHLVCPNLKFSENGAQKFSAPAQAAISGIPCCDSVAQEGTFSEVFFKTNRGAPVFLIPLPVEANASLGSRM